MGSYIRHVAEDKKRRKDMRLGRQVEHDPRSLDYLVAADGTVRSKMWRRHTAVLFQGDLGSCSGNAACGVLGSDPFWPTLAAKRKAGLKLDEKEAVRLYSAATHLDHIKGMYPPTDTGSSGLGVAKAVKAAGYISEYRHITSMAAAHTAIQYVPFIVGLNWYASMDEPDHEGVVKKVSGKMEGAHEFQCRGYDARRDLWWFVNSWGDWWGKRGGFAMSSDSFDRLMHENGDATVFVPLKGLRALQPSKAPKA